MNQSQADANRAGSAPLPPPEHLSEPAQAILRAGDDMLGDLADYRSARQRINRIADARSQSVRDEGTDFEFEAVDTNGARSYWITSARQDDTERVLVYAHGGGYVAGEAARVIEHPLRLGRAARLPVLSVEYGRAPENPWPAALEDCLRAHQWLLEQGYAPRHIAWSGLSAGGGIVVAMALAARERNIPLPGAIYGMAPWADLTLSGDSYRVNAPHDHVLGRQRHGSARGHVRGLGRQARTDHFTRLRRPARTATLARGRRNTGNTPVRRGPSRTARPQCRRGRDPGRMGRALAWLSQCTGGSRSPSGHPEGRRRSSARMLVVTKGDCGQINY